MCGNWISHKLQRVFKICHNTTEKEKLIFCSRVLANYVQFQELVLFGQRPIAVYELTQIQTSHPTPQHHEIFESYEVAFKAMYAKLNMEFLNERQKQAYCHFGMIRILKKLAEEEATKAYTMDEYSKLIDYLAKISHAGHIKFSLRL